MLKQLTLPEVQVPLRVSQATLVMRQALELFVRQQSHPALKED